MRRQKKDVLDFEKVTQSGSVRFTSLVEFFCLPSPASFSNFIEIIDEKKEKRERRKKKKKKKKKQRRKGARERERREREREREDPRLRLVLGAWCFAFHHHYYTTPSTIAHRALDHARVTCPSLLVPATLTLRSSHHHHHHHHYVCWRWVPWTEELH